VDGAEALEVVTVAVADGVEEVRETGIIVDSRIRAAIFVLVALPRRETCAAGRWIIGASMRPATLISARPLYSA